MPRLTLFAQAVVLLVLLAPAAPDPARADAPPRGTVRVIHDWEGFPRLAGRLDALGAGAPAEARASAVREHYAASGRRLAGGYFAWRGAGDPASGVADWLALHPAASGAIASALADSATRERIHAGAAEFERRLARVVAPGDTVTLVLLVGAFEEPVLTYDVGATRVVAVQLECFLPLTGRLGAETRESLASRVSWRPGAPLRTVHLFAWSAYAAASVFLPELRDRKLRDSASLAETVLLKGFSARFAAALFPGFGFKDGGALVTETAFDKVALRWRTIGARWFSYGTEPYLSAVLEDSVLAAVPEGVTVEEAAAVLGSALTGEWLDAARVSRTKDEAAEISRLGRFPTLYAWGLLEP